jgi:hypothetical protein
VIPLAVAAASPGTERAAWPALPLEQPVVTSRGWWQFTGAWVRPEDGAELEARFGVSSRLELSVAEALQAGEDGARLAAPTLGGRWLLGAAEAPSRSVALVGAMSPPWDGASPEGAVGLVGAWATAPVRWTLDGRAGLGPEGVVGRLEAEALLQVGPVAPFGGVVLGVASRGPVVPVPSLGGQLNLSRGLALWGRHRWDPAGRELRLGVRVAL